MLTVWTSLSLSLTENDSVFDTVSSNCTFLESSSQEVISYEPVFAAGIPS